MQLTEGFTTLADLGVGTGPVVVRNNHGNIATFTDENTRAVYTWEAAGDPHGRDVKEVSATILANPTFRENVNKGIFAIENDQDILRQALDAQRSHWQSRQHQAENAQVEIENAQAQVVAAAEPCIAPRGRELCGSYAVVSGNDQSGEPQPPLCGEHKHLAPQYQPNTTGRVVDGKPEVIWKRVTPTRAV